MSYSRGVNPNLRRGQYHDGGGSTTIAEVEGVFKDGVTEVGKVDLRQTNDGLSFYHQGKKSFDVKQAVSFEEVPQLNADNTANENELIKLKTLNTRVSDLKTEILNTNYLKKTDGDAKYYDKVTSDAKYLTKTDADTKYYDKATSDARYHDKTASDTKYLTKTDANTTYLKKVDGDTKYYDKANTYQPQTPKQPFLKKQMQT